MMVELIINFIEFILSVDLVKVIEFNVKCVGCIEVYKVFLKKNWFWSIIIVVSKFCIYVNIVFKK